MKGPFETKIQHVLWSFIDFFYPPFRRLFSLEFFRYGFTGAMNVVMGWVVYYLIYHYILHQEPLHIGSTMISSHTATLTLQWPITFLTGFWLARNISFSESPLKGRVQIRRYLLVNLFNIALLYGGQKLFVEVLGIWPTVSYIILSFFCALASYFLNKYFSFESNIHGHAKSDQE